MADRKFTYTIGINGDASQLKAEINNAMKALQSISSLKSVTNNNGLGLTQDLREAAQAASQLQSMLTGAITKAGTLDLTKFQSALKNSGMSLDQYAQTLQAIGPTGEEAFMSVASAVSKAEIPLYRTSDLMNQLWTTMKNTMRWQLTSSVLRGFIGTLESAVGYAKDLNQSLNNIQIVTQKSTESMREYAKAANEAASRLNTTTTDYTDASLIYYQQGLTDEEVAARTETTIKLANVTGESAQKVSEEMTAIWNNFAEGSENLEHYADVITALGATTASSSAEIADGVQKFAAVASSVGLSYEYATTALATLVAETRESPDIIGTSLRTLFARIQGLTQDEEQEDGTNLNKYSEALQAVGVNIKDVNGDLKGMNQILDETAARWSTLSTNQQLALAQTVAGVRQYTQFVALINNWDKFQQNLATAQNAEGQLNTQAETYAQSWEAARKRVKAASEDIYDSLLNEQFFVDFDNALAKIFHQIANVIDAMGGMKGVLVTLGAVFTQVFSKQLSQSLQNLVYNVRSAMGRTEDSAISFKQNMAQVALNMATDSAAGTKLPMAVVQAQDVQMQTAMASVAKELTEEQLKQLDNYREMIKSLQTLVSQQLKLNETANNSLKEFKLENLTGLTTQFEGQAKQMANTLTKTLLTELGDIRIPTLALDNKTLTTSMQSLDGIVHAIRELSVAKGTFNAMTKELEGLSTQGNMSEEALRGIQAKFQELTGIDLSGSNADQTLEAIRSAAEHAGISIELLRNKTIELTGATDENAEILAGQLEELERLGTAAGDAGERTRHGMELAKQSIQDFYDRLVEASNASMSWSEAIVTSTGYIFKLGMAMQSLKTIIGVFKEGKLDAESLMQSLTSVAMILPTVISLYNLVKKSKVEYNLVTGLEAIKDATAAGAKVVCTTAVEGETAAIVANTAAWSLSPLGVVLLAITALVTGFTIFNAIIEENTAKVENASKAIQDASDSYSQARQELESLNQEIESTDDRIEELNSQDTLTLVEQEELEKLERSVALLEREQALRKADEQKQAKATASIYDKNFKTVRDDYVNYLNKVENLNKKIADQEQQLLDKETRRAKLQSEQPGFTDSRYNTILDAQDISLQSQIDADKQELEQLIQDNSQKVEEFHDMISGMEDTWNAILEEYSGEEFMSEAQDIFDSSSFLELQEALKQELGNQYYSVSIKPILDNTALGQLEEGLIGRFRKIGDIGDKSIADVVDELGLTADEAENLIKWLVSSGTTLENLYNSILETANKIRGNQSFTNSTDIARLERFLDKLQGADFELALQIVGADDFDEFYEKFRHLENNSTLKFTLDFQGAFDSAKSAIDTIIEGEWIDNEQIAALKEKFANIYDFSGFESLSLYDQARSLTESLETLYAAPDLFSADMSDRVTRYKTEIQDLDERINMLTDSLANVKKWSNTWDDANERAEELSETIDELKTEKINLQVDLDDAEEALESLKDFEMDPIRVEIENEQIEATIAQMTAINKAASLIGEGFKVATKDVEELARTLPEVLVGARVLADGTVQLSQDTVNKVADALEGEIAIRREQQQQILQDRINLGLQEIGVVSQVRDAAITGKKEEVTAVLAADSEIGGNAEVVARKIIQSKIQQKIQSITASQQTASNEITDMNDVATASGENARITQTNWVTGFRGVDSAAWQAFSNVVQYMNQTAAGAPVRKGAYVGALTAQGFSKGSSELSQNYKSVGDEWDNVRKYIENFDIGDVYNDDFFQKAVGMSKEEFNNLAKTDPAAWADVFEKFAAARDEAGVGKDIVDKLGELGYKIDESALGSSDTFLDEFFGNYRDENGEFKDTFITDLTQALSDLVYENALDQAQLSRYNAANSGYDNLRTAGDPKDKKSSKAKEEKTKDPKEEAKLEEKALKDLEDRYHEINRAIKDQSELLDDINEKMDLAYGKSRLNQFGNKIEQLNKQAENFKGKMSLASHFIEVDKQALKDTLGLTDEAFDPDTGELLHYQDILEDIMDDYNVFIREYNAFIDKYNAATAEEQEQLEKQLETLKLQKEVYDDMYDTKLELLDKYEESLDEYQDALNEYEQKMREIEDAKLEEITYKMEVILEVKEAKDWVREFTRDIAESLGDELYHTLAAPQQIGGKGTAILDYEQAQAEVDLLSSYQEEYDALVQRLNEANEYTNINDIKDAFLELEQNIIDSGEAILEWIDSIETLLPNAIDAARKRFDQFTDQLAHNTTMLETIRELYVLQGQTYKTQQGFDRLQRTTKERMDAATANAILNKEWSERAKKDLDIAQAALESLVSEYGGDEIAAEEDARYDTFKANRDALLQEFNEAQEAMYQSAQEAMEAAKDMYLEQIERAVYEFGQELSDGAGLDLLQDKYDHYIEENHRYFDQVNEAYQVSYWYNKLQQDIDKSSNVRFTEKLKKLQQEIDLRREGNTLSEYDMKILEAKYKVLQAQMALEEAMNTKDELRLVRDRQGNWNYQYVANPDELVNKQQELLDAENEWYNIAKQQVEDVTGEIIDAWTQCQQEIRDIYNDMTLTDQERADRAEEIYRYYTDKIKFLENEKQVALADTNEAGNKHLFDMTLLHTKEIEDLTGISEKMIQDILDQSGKDKYDLLLDDWDEIRSMTDDQGQNILELVGQQSETLKNLMTDNNGQITLFDKTYVDALADMTKNTATFETSLEKALTNMQEDYDNYGVNVQNVADKTGTSLENLDQKVNELSDSTDRCRDAGWEMAESMWNILDAVQNLSMEYANLAASIMEAVFAMQQLAAASAAQVERAANMDIPSSTPQLPTQSGGGAVSFDVSGLAAQLAQAQGLNNVEDLSDEDLAALWALQNGKVDENPDLEKWRGGLVTQGNKALSGLQNGNLDTSKYRDWENLGDALNDPNLPPELRDRWKQYAAGFATGGYTGDFTDGKLAFLHEKELVLNQDDTKNMLAAVSTVRALEPALLKVIESKLDASAQSGVALMSSRLSANSVGTSIREVQQDVHIEAVFPNVTEHNEIIEAFNGLIDEAAQFAFTKQD